MKLTHVINYSFSFTTEVSIYLFIWIVMLGAGVLVRDKGHPAITLLVDKVPVKWKRPVQISQILISVLFLGVLFYQGLMMTINMQGHLSPAAQIPMALVYLSLPIGTLIMLIYFLEEIIKGVNSSER